MGWRCQSQLTRSRKAGLTGAKRKQCCPTATRAPLKGSRPDEGVFCQISCRSSALHPCSYLGYWTFMPVSTCKSSMKVRLLWILFFSYAFLCGSYLNVVQQLPPKSNIPVFMREDFSNKAFESTGLKHFLPDNSSHFALPVAGWCAAWCGSAFFCSPVKENITRFQMVFYTDKRMCVIQWNVSLMRL